ncbi:hypothetical protein [Streptomyces prunicolor]|uniref:hypothetical protein n=1 Tax=Streptomyces prunicolor TaxID=67348 RepID=UPI0003612D78|nr:hypothetical protein [Streptomyces prunicolor]
MAYKLAGAATAACATGGILTGDGVFRHTWETSAAGVGFLAVGVAGVLAATIRYMLARFEERTRRDLDEVAEQRRHLELEMQQRELNLERREGALSRSKVTGSVRIASYAYELDRNRTLVSQLRLRVEEQQTEIEEINDERNQLIARELLLTRGQFTQRSYGALKAVAGANAHALYPSGGGESSAEVTVLYADHGREHR